MRDRPQTTPEVASTGTRQLLVVAGPGRSGTSLFTGLTAHLGMYIPKPEVKANRSNPRGFGEPRWAVDFHNELLAGIDINVDDGRPESWQLADGVVDDDGVRARLRGWLEQQFQEADRVVVKDPRLGWFFELYRATAADVGADIKVATMLRHPAEVLRSRELAYGTRSPNTTRMVGWMNMMLGLERRTRTLARATIRYDDLLLDWRAAVAQADASLGLGLLDDPEAAKAADALVDPSLRRSVAAWSELGLPDRTLDLATRVFDTYSRLVECPGEDPDAVRSDLDALGDEFVAWFDECFEVSRARTGARVRHERRTALRRTRTEMRDQMAAQLEQQVHERSLPVRLRRAVGRARRTVSTRLGT